MPVHIGDFGRALSRMAPSGAVEVNGERLDARSDGQVIEAGSNVIVLRGDPTGYVVRALEPGKPVPTLPRQGEEIVKADFARNTAATSAVSSGCSAPVRAWGSGGRSSPNRGAPRFCSAARSWSGSSPGW
jgi:NfeD-like C-terminal, partner-binding